MTAEQKWPGGIILAALPAKSTCMELDEIVAATGLDRRKVITHLSALKSQGMILTLHDGCYARTPEGDAAIRTPRTSGRKGRTKVILEAKGLPARLWRALRMKQRATYDQLLEIAQPSGAYSRHGRPYLLALINHGVVVVSGRPGRGEDGRALKQYVLVRNLGLRAPVWLAKTGVLFDPNKGAAVKLPADKAEAQADV